LPKPCFSLFIYVLHFYFTTKTTVYLTLTERVTLANPSFLFTFRPRTPGPAAYAEAVPVATNSRSQEFEIDVDAVFANRSPGQWDYEVREFQDPAPEDITGSRLDTIIASAGRILETGLMDLHKDTSFAYVQRETTTKFIQPS
jgi:hypothetical protein